LRCPTGSNRGNFGFFHGVQRRIGIIGNARPHRVHQFPGILPLPSTIGAGTSWNSEKAWSSGGGGYISAVPIPQYQTTVDMTANNGSTQYRDFPDVATVAVGIEVVHTDPQNGPGQIITSGGTSASAPLWAAFTALVNQQAHANGQAPVGFINPAIYAIGESPSYRYTFHDITTGTNTNNGNSSQFSAVQGYDPIFIITPSATPALRKLRAAVLRRSWKSNPGTPAFSHAFAQVPRKSRTG